MIRIVTARRLRALEDSAAAAAGRAAEVQAGADRALARHVGELTREAHRAALADRRATEAEARSDRAEQDITKLIGEVRAVEARLAEPRYVYLLLRRGHLHSVHGSETAAYAAAESDPAEPAYPGGWGAWRPAGTAEPDTRWSVCRISVHAPDAGVHDTPAGVHGGESGG